MTANSCSYTEYRLFDGFSALLMNARVADLHLDPASTLPLLQPLKHPSPHYIGVSDLGTAGLAPRITFVLGGGMLPSNTDPIVIPHPFSLTLSKGGLL